MQSSIIKYLQGQLQQREEAGNKRKLFLREGIDFYSNDYLGIATNHVSSLTPLIHPSKLGSTGSRLLSGNCRTAEELENFLATFHQTEGALLFNSGYDANIGLLSAVANRHTTILYDELSHASIIDGIRLSLCKQSFHFKHNDCIDLENKLRKFSNKDTPLLIVIESVYSMEGDQAPLQEILNLSEKYGAEVIVDEAHATGVFGSNGQGLVQQLGLQDLVFARVHTFGKALGCHGAVIVGTSLLKSFLINFARSFIFTTALPEQTYQDIQSVYEVQSDPTRRAALMDNIAYFNQQKHDIGSYEWIDSHSPIQCLIIGNNIMARQLATACQQASLNISAILSPTVAKGGERIRICLHSFNTHKEIDLLLNHITLWLKK